MNLDLFSLSLKIVVDNIDPVIISSGCAFRIEIVSFEVKDIEGCLDFDLIVICKPGNREGAFS